MKLILCSNYCCQNVLQLMLCRSHLLKCSAFIDVIKLHCVTVYFLTLLFPTVGLPPLAYIYLASRLLLHWLSTPQGWTGMDHVTSLTWQGSLMSDDVGHETDFRRIMMFSAEHWNMHTLSSSQWHERLSRGRRRSLTLNGLRIVGLQAKWKGGDADLKVGFMVQVCQI